MIPITLFTFVIISLWWPVQISTCIMKDTTVNRKTRSTYTMPYNIHRLCLPSIAVWYEGCCSEVEFQERVQGVWIAPSSCQCLQGMSSQGCCCCPFFPKFGMKHHMTVSFLVALEVLLHKVDLVSFLWT